MDEKLLRREERAVFSLRSLYRKYGYLPFKMSKFEEYELYVRNKDFLVSDRVIAFNDTNGRLMALKPDVTLSIIKNGEDASGIKQKVYYNENVYRVSESTHRYKEIMQAGLECIGDIDLYDIYEVISLAAESLAQINENFILEISHLGILSAVLASVSTDPSFEKDVLGCISEKNAHDLARICEQYGIGDADYRKLCIFITAYGERRSVLDILRGLGDLPYFGELETVSAMLDKSPYADRIRFDFSVVNDMSYYNGFVFKGFLDGICNGVLAGGQYDRMMEKMGRKSRAVGFAVYLDMLEQLPGDENGYDVDILLLYDDTNSRDAVAAKVSELISAGFSVSAQKAFPEKLRYKIPVDMRGEGKSC